jgi:hypothetical protein
MLEKTFFSSLNFTFMLFEYTELNFRKQAFTFCLVPGGNVKVEGKSISQGDNPISLSSALLKPGKITGYQ